QRSHACSSFVPAGAGWGELVIVDARPAGGPVTGTDPGVSPDLLTGRRFGVLRTTAPPLRCVRRYRLGAGRRRTARPHAYTRPPGRYPSLRQPAAGPVPLPPRPGRARPPRCWPAVRGRRRPP